jgi:hypothetical protein
MLRAGWQRLQMRQYAPTYPQQAVKRLHLLLRAERLRPEPAATVQ